MTNRKKEKWVKAAKKKKQKKIVIASVLAVVLIVITVVIILNVNPKNKAGNNSRYFTDGSQTVILLNDGSFSARLSHNKKIDGQYKETAEGSTAKIIFTYNGTSVSTTVTNNILTIPNEWDDHHGHNKRLQLHK